MTALPLILAHEGAPLAPHDLWRAWSLDPAVVGSLATGAALYAVGLRRLADRAGWTGARRLRALRFALGYLVLGLALVSPLHALGGSLFSAHMVQHELLMVVAAPLLVAAEPLVPILWALPQRWRGRVGRWASRGTPRTLWRWATLPFIAFTLHALAIWLWHLPTLYAATLTSEAVHAAQHLSFFGTALLFWWALTRGSHADRRWGVALAYVIVTAAHTGALGVLLTLWPKPLYPIYATRTAPWGLTPLEDQQLAGLIMWVPAGLAYLAAALLFAKRWIEGGARRLAPVAATALVMLAALTACARREPGREDAARALTGGEPHRGALAARRYGCAACHTIAGVPGATALVGPPLTGIAERAYIAGVLSNTPENLVRWIQHPRAVDSLTAMPELGVSDRDARDLAAYLYSIH